MIEYRDMRFTRPDSLVAKVVVQRLPDDGLAFAHVFGGVPTRLHHLINEPMDPHRALDLVGARPRRRAALREVLVEGFEIADVVFAEPRARGFGCIHTPTWADVAVKGGGCA